MECLCVTCTSECVHLCLVCVCRCVFVWITQNERARERERERDILCQMARKRVRLLSVCPPLALHGIDMFACVLFAGLMCHSAAFSMQHCKVF